LVKHVVMLVVALVVLAISAPANAAVLCANSSGSVVLRAACKGSEQRVDPVALGLQGPAGLSGYEVVSKHFESTAGLDNLIIHFGAFAACPAGKKVLGGGGNGTWLDGSNAVHPAAIVSGTPQVVSGEHQWVIAIQKSDGAFFLAEEGVSGTVFAICASAQ
jgi:hypothetical protein